MEYFEWEAFEGEHFRAFPISNWTENGRVELHFERKYCHPFVVLCPWAWSGLAQRFLIPISEFLKLEEGEITHTKKYVSEPFHDITITGGIESDADTLEKIVLEVSAMKQTERGNRRR